ncbi:MAG: phosphoribosylformylglycinamidine synthase subunit PurQ [Patescibacteria group bacterium]
MKRPRIAVISFPGNNCEVESLRVIKETGMEAMFFRWNDDRSKLQDVGGYFIPGGFSYEDRGRSGMVAARDPLMKFLSEEAAKGKTIIGNCNGAQILIESGLVPLNSGLAMSLARNAVRTGAGWSSPGFLSEWVWIHPVCSRNRCATSDWEAPMHLPIAHGEGRFVTTDPDLVAELQKGDQIAFAYCTEAGEISEEPSVAPNGSTLGIAGICNPAGNVVALMPHPERTDLGKPYFDSLRRWIEAGKGSAHARHTWNSHSWKLEKNEPRTTEVFIDTIITNNEERTVEQAARRVVANLTLKQWKYFSIPKKDPGKLLSDLSIFNPNKERAFIRRGDDVTRWNPDSRQLSPQKDPVFAGMLLVRKDIPDTGAISAGDGGESGVCYMVQGISEADLKRSDVLEIFANPHASTLEMLQ